MKRRTLLIIISVLIAGSLVCGPAVPAYGLDYTDYSEQVTADAENNHLSIFYYALLPKGSSCYSVFTFKGGDIVWVPGSDATHIGSTHSTDGSLQNSYDISGVYSQSKTVTLGSQTYRAIQTAGDAGSIYDKKWCESMTYTSKQELYTMNVYLYKMTFDIYGMDTRDLTGISFYCIEKNKTGTCFKTVKLEDAVAQIVPYTPEDYEVTLRARVPAESLDESYGDTVLSFTVTDEAMDKNYYINLLITPQLPIEDGYYIAQKNITISSESYLAGRTRACRRYFVEGCERDGMTVTFTMDECNPGGLAHTVLTTGP